MQKGESGLYIQGSVKYVPDDPSEGASDIPGALSTANEIDA